MRNKKKQNLTQAECSPQRRETLLVQTALQGGGQPRGFAGLQGDSTFLGGGGQNQAFFAMPSNIWLNIQFRTYWRNSIVTSLSVLEASGTLSNTHHPPSPERQPDTSLCVHQLMHVLLEKGQQRDCGVWGKRGVEAGLEGVL